MKFSSLDIEACILMKNFCNDAKINYELVPVDTDGEEVFLYDLTILASGIAILIRDRDIHVYTYDHDVYLDRHSFVSLTII